MIDSKKVSLAITPSVLFTDSQPGESSQGKATLPIAINLGGNPANWIASLEINTGGYGFAYDWDLATALGTLTTAPSGGGVAAAATRTQTGGAANTDRRWTIAAPGFAGNRYLLEEPWPLPENNPLSVSIHEDAYGWRNIRISPKTNAGTRQVETATAVGTATANGKVRFTITSALIAGSPLVVDVDVLAGDLPSDWAAKGRTALRQLKAIVSKMNVIGTAAQIALSSKSAAWGNDSTLNIAISNGTPSPGITPAASSANTTTAVLPAIISTVEEVRAAVAANARVASEVSLAHINGSTGAGVWQQGMGNTFSGGRDAFTVIGGDGKLVNGDDASDGLYMCRFLAIQVSPLSKVHFTKMALGSTYDPVPSMDLSAGYDGGFFTDGALTITPGDFEGNGVLSLSAPDGQCPAIIRILVVGAHG